MTSFNPTIHWKEIDQNVTFRNFRIQSNESVDQMFFLADQCNPSNKVREEFVNTIRIHAPEEFDRQTAEELTCLKVSLTAIATLASAIVIVPVALTVAYTVTTAAMWGLALLALVALVSYVAGVSEQDAQISIAKKMYHEVHILLCKEEIEAHEVKMTQLKEALPALTECEEVTQILNQYQHTIQSVRDTLAQEGLYYKLRNHEFNLLAMLSNKAEDWIKLAVLKTQLKEIEEQIEGLGASNPEKAAELINRSKQLAEDLRKYLQGT
jgi:hypothetical protein